MRKIQSHSRLGRPARRFEFDGRQFSLEAAHKEAAHKIAPTQEVLTVREDGEGRQAAFMCCGLIPSWAKDPAAGSRIVNARVEAVGEKPAFRTAFRRRRCLIPADGFYE